MNNAVVSQDKLSAALGMVGRAAPSRMTLPVLSHVLLETCGNTLALTCSDLEVTIQAQIAAQVDGDSQYTVPAKMFADLVNALSQEHIELVFGTDLGVLCGKSESKVKGLIANEFPIMPIPQNEAVTIDSALLKQALAGVVIAAAVDESRLILTGVLFEFGECLTLAAADGFRLAVGKAAIKGKGKVVIPLKAALELARLLIKPATVQMTLDNDRAFFELTYQDGPIQSALLVTQLIAGNFPDYNQIIPKSHTMTIVVDRAPLLAALKQANIYSRMEDNQIVMDIHDVEMTIKATTAEMGEIETTIPIRLGGGDEELVILFDARYLSAGILAIDAEQVLMEFADATSPGVLRPIDNSDYVYVIMPMQIRGQK